MAALSWGADTEPADEHPLTCAVWTSDDECSCDPPEQRPIPRLTTAELIDLIAQLPAKEEQ